MKMDKKTKLYLGIGVTALVIYLIWKNRQQFGGSVDVQTPLGGVRASVGGGQVSVGVNPAPSMTMADMNAMNAMNGGMVLPDGMMVEQAV
jgi:hypothetical protein